jgi:uncharacterized protein YaeQ
LAIKPTIYKFNINLSDLDRQYYDTLNLTVAQHPSETTERMMARVLAYSLNAQDSLSFTKGLSEPDEPDICLRTLDDQLAMWIDVGEPAVDRIKKATRLAHAVKVYSFNSKSVTWWQQAQPAYSQLSASIFRFDPESIKTLSAFVTRTMDMSVTISGDSVFVATESGECEVACTTLLDPLSD